MGALGRGMRKGIMLTKTRVLSFADHPIKIGLERKWYDEAMGKECSSVKAVRQRRLL